MSIVELFQLFPAPSALSVVLITVLLLVAIAACDTSRGDPASDRHFILVATVGAGLAIVGLGWALRLLTGVHPRWYGLGDPAGFIRASLLVVSVGSGVLIARLALGNLAMLGVLGAGSVQRENRISRMTNEIAHDLRSAPATVVLSSRCRAPLTTGVLTPRIVLPEDAVGWDDRRLHAVLLHEHAHVARRDCLSQLLVQLLGAFLWWNPAFWMVRRRCVLFREVACDEWVVARYVDPAWYARLLVSISSSRQGFASVGFGTVPMAAPASIRGRIERIMAPAREAVGLWQVGRPEVVKLLLIAVVVISVADVLGRATLAMMQLEDDESFVELDLY